MFQSGDVIKVVHMPERTGMNGWIGSVERFDDATQKYKIQVRSKGVSSTINLKPENVELASAKIFSDSERPICLLSELLLSSERFMGSTYLDQNCVVSEGVTEISENIAITESIIIRGATRALLMDAFFIPQCQILFCKHQYISIHCKNETLQFEDIDFSAQSHDNKYNCLALYSGNVVFRRCRFNGQCTGILCGKPQHVVIPGLDTEGIELTVRFENCLFEDFDSQAVDVRATYSAKFLCCTFRNNKVGILVSEGGTAVVISCVFTKHADSAIQSEDRLCSLHITDCCIDTTRLCGIFIYKSNVAVIERCMITNCRAYGIMVEDKTVIKIISSSISMCGYGIFFGVGEIRTEVTDSRITNNLECGIMITDLCLGSIALTNNTITMNRGVHDVANSSVDCSVVVDGNNFPVNNLFTESQKRANYSRLLSTRANNSTQLLNTQRAFKAVGIVELAPQCNRCNVDEPKDKKFLKCGRCEGVVYCSKDCQKNDWTEHKVVCKFKGTTSAALS
jgi:hypothetical protein